MPTGEAREIATSQLAGGLETARAVVGAATVALIMFQGPKGDGVVNSLNESRMFGSASKAKSAVDYVTYGLIFGFIALSAVLAASGSAGPGGCNASAPFLFAIFQTPR